MNENKIQGDWNKIYHRRCTCSKNPIDFKTARNNNFSNIYSSNQRYPCIESAEFKYIYENQNNDEKNDKPYVSSDSRIERNNCNNDPIFDENIHFNKSEVITLKSNEIGVFTISKFSEEDVKY